MEIKRNHLLQALIWGLVFLFMGYKSLVHTISVHDQGVQKTMQNYRVQAQARLNFLRQLINDPSDGYPFLDHQITLIQNQSNSYQSIMLNDNLTLYIDTNMAKWPLSSQQKADLMALQQTLKQESIMYNAHALRFNQRIQSFPYTLVSKEILPRQLTNQDVSQGVIVER
jgi:hypothetical protein